RGRVKGGRLPRPVMPIRFTAVVFVAVLLGTSGCGTAPPPLQNSANPIPEVHVDLGLATLVSEVDGLNSRLRVHSGKEFAAVFIGGPNADYSLELVELSVFRRPGNPAVAGYVSGYECRLEVRLK